MPILSAVRLRSSAEEFEVKEKNRGTPPNGFTIGKSARNVALAAVGNVLSTCATTFGAVIVNSRSPMLQEKCRHHTDDHFGGQPTGNNLNKLDQAQRRSGFVRCPTEA